MLPPTELSIFVALQRKGGVGLVLSEVFPKSYINDKIRIDLTSVDVLLHICSIIYFCSGIF